MVPSRAIGPVLGAIALVGPALLLGQFEPRLWTPLTFLLMSAVLWPLIPRQVMRTGTGMALFFAATFVGVYWLAERADGRDSPTYAIPVCLLLSGIGAIMAIREVEAKARPVSLMLFVFASLLVAYFSAGTGGGGNVADLLAGWLSGNVALAKLLVVIGRKLVHITFYGVCAAILMRALRLSPHRLWLSGAFVLNLAIFDEWRQSALGTRSGSGWDVLLDMTSVLIVLLTIRKRTVNRADVFVE